MATFSSFLLGEALGFSSGKSVKPGGVGRYPVYGAAGVIGYSDGFLYSNAIIIGRVGAYCGAVEYCGGRFWASDNTIVARVTDCFDVAFMYYLLVNMDLRRYAGGAAQPLMTQTVIKGITAAAPPLPIQRKIAAILSAYDDLIENNLRRIELLEEIAQVIYREWFVHFRFPGHEGVTMVESGLGPIPAGWEVRKVSDIAEINARSVKKGQEPEELLYIDIASVSPGRIDKIEQLAFADAPGRARRIVQHGDTIWSTVRPNRRSYAIILRPPPSLIVSTGFAVISAKEAPYSYVYHALTTDDFVEYLTNHTTGSAYPAVNSGDFEDATVLLPPSTILNSFHSVVANLLDQTHNLHTRNANLRLTRDLLLPKLISGELDVTDLDIDTGGLEA